MTVLLRGEPNIKIINGTKTSVEPVVALEPYKGEKDPKYLQMGVGVVPVHKDRTLLFWGPMCPRDLITSYRGMKIAGYMPQLDEELIAGCWFAGQETDNWEQPDLISRVMGMIRSDAPDGIIGVGMDLDPALDILHANDIDYEFRPILREMRKGTIQPSPGIDAAVQRYSDELFVLDSRLTKTAERLTKHRPLSDAEDQELIGLYNQFATFITGILPSINDEFYRLKDEYSVDKELALEGSSLHFANQIIAAQAALMDLELATRTLARPLDRITTFRDALYDFCQAVHRIAGIAYSGIEDQHGESPRLLEKSVSLLRHVNREAQKGLEGVYELR